jgi:Zn-dependent M28 family amino/carboxypeptidase
MALPTCTRFVLAVYVYREFILYALSGADDDGSGSVTILEAYRALISADFRPERAIEFHWYSAEVIVVNLLGR